MTMPFAFLHQRCAFTLLSAVAIVFALIRSELTVSSARRLQVSDLVLGVAAGALLIDRVVARVPVREGRELLFAQSRLPDEVRARHRRRAIVDHSDHGVSVMGGVRR